MAKAKLEVEAKARVADPEAARRKLGARGRPLGEIDYRDTYFAPGPAPGFTERRFRLRRGPGRATVTVKERACPGACEASRELEFEVSDAEGFAAFARMFGFEVLIEKVKRGERWDLGAGPDGGPEAVAELVEIAGLGWFLEIEMLVGEETEVAAARERVLGLFAELGYGPEDLAREPYTFMLYQFRHGGGG